MLSLLSQPHSLDRTVLASVDLGRADVARPSNGAPARQREASGEGGAQTASPQVLLVDDNVVVRKGLAKALQAAGFAVTVAENGLAALMQIDVRQYRAIILDIMMPVMDGAHFYEQLVTEYPSAARRVLFVTAWADDPTVQSFLADTGRPVLQKPFEIEEFVDAVRRVAARP